MRHLSARVGLPALYVLVGLACSDDSNGPMDPEPGPGVERIAFTSDRDGDFDIYVMNVDGTEVEQLTDDPGRDVEPDWSPDGSRIVFASDRGNDPEFTDIWVMNADGSGLTQLTDTTLDFEPAWSPDGSRIAFSSERDGNLEIYVMDTDGGNVMRLTNNDDLDISPAWSPDGSMIAFTKVDSEDGTIHDIHVMNDDGSGDTALPHPGPDGFAAWSPDGSRIAFAGNPTGTGVDIFVVDPDGSNITNLINDPPTMNAFDRTPEWSPDGDFIAFATDRDGFPNREIYVMTDAGADPVNLTDDAAVDTDPAWSPEP